MNLTLVPLRIAFHSLASSSNLALLLYFMRVNFPLLFFIHTAPLWLCFYWSLLFLNFFPPSRRNSLNRIFLHLNCQILCSLLENFFFWNEMNFHNYECICWTKEFNKLFIFFKIWTVQVFEKDLCKIHSNFRITSSWIMCSSRLCLKNLELSRKISSYSFGSTD